MKNATNDSVYIEVLICAPVQEVWRAWIEPEQILKWFGSDPHGKGLYATIKSRAGGSFEISFKDSDDSEHTCYGEFIEVVELKLLKFTWQWKSEPGLHSLVTVQFSRAGDHALMTLVHGHFKGQSQHDYAVGWKGAFNKLERLLTTSE